MCVWRERATTDRRYGWTDRDIHRQTNTMTKPCVIQYNPSDLVTPRVLKRRSFEATKRNQVRPAGPVVCIGSFLIHIQECYSTSFKYKMDLARFFQLSRFHRLTSTHRHRADAFLAMRSEASRSRHIGPNSTSSAPPDIFLAKHSHTSLSYSAQQDRT